ncbi:WD40 repeat [Arabidopsis suecica]|uniref:WD40 repeat n=1 Tax=Arabidopsis suecica TaxID=45249 RepID=A0A8T1YKH6_ARASU|nr:WD40 repeat [Arabidopsis suecica]
MKFKNEKKKGFGAKRIGKKSSIDRDPFFEEETKKRGKFNYDDEDIESVESEEEGKVGEEIEDKFSHETVGEKRKRLVEETLDRIEEAKRKEREEDDEEDDGVRDSLVVKTLMQEQLEKSGRVQRAIASRVQEPQSSDEFRVIVKHQQSVTGVALSDDDSRGFSVSKDGTILHWDVSSGKSDEYKWPSNEVLKSHGLKFQESWNTRHNKQSLALAVSSDGRYVATGGVDCHVHLWDVRTREHVQAFIGHRGIVSSLCFREGTAELFSGSYDRTLRIWNAEDRTHIDSSFGHQSEILSIDALRRECVLSVGRDRTLQLYKVPESTHLIFRASEANLECCCFVNSDEFLAGSDNGSIALWSILNKKPVFIVKNAHHVIADHDSANHNCTSACSWVSSVAVCRGSDLAASGAGDGCVRLWGVESGSRAIQPLFGLPLPGFVNSLAFAKSGQFLIAGVGQEPRLGRWGCLKSAQNGVAIHPLRLS